MGKRNRVRHHANRVVHSNTSGKSRHAIENQLLEQIVQHGHFKRDRQDAKDLLRVARARVGKARSKRSREAKKGRY